jgi:hypothetical protein
MSLDYAGKSHIKYQEVDLLWNFTILEKCIIVTLVYNNGDLFIYGISDMALEKILTTNSQPINLQKVNICNMKTYKDIVLGTTGPNRKSRFIVMYPFVYIVTIIKNDLNNLINYYENGNKFKKMSRCIYPLNIKLILDNRCIIDNQEHIKLIINYCIN